MLADTQQRIAEFIDAGHSLDEIERELIESAKWLDDEERAALWLFAWAYQGTGNRRRRGAAAALVGARA